MLKITSIIFSCVLFLGISFSKEPITPIPLKMDLDQQKVKLGKRLFHEVKLSKDNSISCANCHIIAHYGVDGVKASLGVGGAKGGRNSPTVLNVVFNESYFWDGRAEDLEDQVNGPIHNPIEMKSNWKEILSKLSKEESYIREFKKVFKDGEISPKNIRSSIAEFERSLTTPNSPFDKFLRGDQKAITERQKKGYKLFKKYGCVSCHQGVNIGGNMLQVFGVVKDLPKDTLGKDKGRFNVTKDESDLHVYRVPTLRNIEFTGPYFHDGSVDDLKDAIRIMARYQLGKELKDEEVDLIYEFLKSLTGELKIER